MIRKIKKKGKNLKINPSTVPVLPSIDLKNKGNYKKKYPPQAYDFFSKDNDNVV